MSDPAQVEFELRFFAGVLERHPHYLEVLRAHAQNLALTQQYHESLRIDLRIIELLPADPKAHYNLACGYALLAMPEEAIATLRKAIDLGYRDVNYILHDRDLDSLRDDPRFRRLIRDLQR